MEAQDFKLPPSNTNYYQRFGKILPGAGYSTLRGLKRMLTFVLCTQEWEIRDKQMLLKIIFAHHGDSFNFCDLKNMKTCLSCCVVAMRLLAVKGHCS